MPTIKHNIIQLVLVYESLLPTIIIMDQNATVQMQLDAQLQGESSQQSAVRILADHVIHVIFEN